jgi:hypothetical protein
MTTTKLNKQLYDLSVGLVDANLQTLQDLLEQREMLLDIAKNTDNKNLDLEIKRLTRSIHRLMEQTQNFTQERKRLFQ